MNRCSIDRIRNVALVGHGGSGKTTLAEALLYEAGCIKRRGSVDDGNSVCDHDPEEIRRQISISSALAPIDWRGGRINLVDTPGYFDFVGEVCGSLRCVEGAIFVVCAASGVEVGTEITSRMADERELPRVLFINKMERENADFQKTLEQLQSLYGQRVVPLQLPIGAGDSFRGYVDLLRARAYVWDHDAMTETDIPADMADEVEAARLGLIEAAAATDDELTLKFLEDEPLTAEEVVSGLAQGTRVGEIVPVLCGAAPQGIGALALLESIQTLLPAPTAGFTTHEGGKDAELTPANDGPLVAQVFKTMADPYVGKMSILRVYSGLLASDSTVRNSSRGEEERIGQLVRLRGKEQIPVSEVGPGDIVAVTKLQATQTGDTLTSKESLIVLPTIDFPEPTLTMAVHPKAKGDEEKIGSGLARLVEEDPTIRTERNLVTKQNLVSGMGEMHLEVVTARLAKKFGVEVELTTPKVPYRETIKGVASADYKHKKQSGGRGQYGHVVIEIEPLPGDSEEGFDFVDKIFGGAVPRQYIPAVEKGIRDTLSEGVYAGYPVVNVRVTLLDGSSHSVDSSEMAFKLAASMAFKKAFMEAQPVLLEPVLDVVATVPEAYMGDVIGDLNKKRGRILGMEPNGDMQVVRAQVPQAEMFRFAIDLRSMTQGRGSFTTSFAQYEEVPTQLADQVIHANPAAQAS